MIEIKPSVNVLNPSYCYNCGKENIVTYDVRLSHRSKEELCTECMWKLYSKLDNIFLGLIKNKKKS